jgi:hypothetical protein
MTNTKYDALREMREARLAVRPAVLVRPARAGRKLEEVVPVDQSPTDARPSVKVRGPSYRYRDPEKWRAYMRAYMRKRRGGS